MSANKKTSMTVVVLLLLSPVAFLSTHSLLRETASRHAKNDDDVKLMGFCAEPVKNNEITFNVIRSHLDVMN